MALLNMYVGPLRHLHASVSGRCRREREGIEPSIATYRAVAGPLCGARLPRTILRGALPLPLAIDRAVFLPIVNPQRAHVDACPLF
jgi:hypothetical protein